MAAGRENGGMVVSLVNRVPARLATLFRQGGVLARVAAPVLERVLPDHPREIVVRGGRARGVRLVAELKREKFYWTGGYESRVQDALAEELRPGGSFWDVGAHLGFFTLLASRLVGPEGKVHAFEPLPANRARLETGISLNDATNVTLHPVALAGRTGSAVLHSHGSTLMWSLLPNGDTGALDVD